MKAAQSARQNALALSARLHVVTAFDTGSTEFYGDGSDTWVTPDAHSAHQIAQRAATRASHLRAGAAGLPGCCLWAEYQRVSEKPVIWQALGHGLVGLTAYCGFPEA